MQLTIDIKESALDKIMYLLENLKSDVKILTKIDANFLDIQAITKDDEDYQDILSGREERKTKPQNYGSMNDIDWD
jgi:regulatory protein YycH of two-component signal transduction system YycFG